MRDLAIRSKDGRECSAEGSKLTQLRDVVRFLDTALHNAPLPHTIVTATSRGAGATFRPRWPLSERAWCIKVTDDSLAPLGVLDRDLAYVRPMADIQQAAGRFVVCNLHREGFAKVLGLDGGRVRLVSPSERYEPIEGHEGEVRFVGVVVGRLAEMS